MPTKYIKLYNDNPDPRQISKIVDCLRNQGIVIYPTDTLYAMGCDIHSHKAVNRLSQIKNTKTQQANFSIICENISQLATYVRPMEKSTFKLINKALPGPFTFILNANKNIPRVLDTPRKTIGIRIPDNPIILAIVQGLGNPLITTSVINESEDIEYGTDPAFIYEKFRDRVDIVIDGGMGDFAPSTVVDCTDESEPVIRRQGKGNLSLFQ